MRLFVLISLLCVVTVPAYAARPAQFSGAYMMQICAMDENGHEIVPGGHNACQSYISGVIDYHNFLKGLSTPPATDFCIPDDEALINIQRWVLLYLLQHKAIHSEFVAAPAVNLALHAYYPCEKGKKKK